MANVYGVEKGQTISKVPLGSVTNKRFVKVSGATGFVAASAVGEKVLGVLQSSGDVTTASQFQAIVLDGIVHVEAGAAVSNDDWVTTDNVGRAITLVAATHATSCGRALNAASEAGEFIAVQLNIIPELSS